MRDGNADAIETLMLLGFTREDAMLICDLVRLASRKAADSIGIVTSSLPDQRMRNIVSINAISHLYSAMMERAKEAGLEMLDADAIQQKMGEQGEK
jgi:hypothetical protein